MVRISVRLKPHIKENVGIWYQMYNCMFVIILLAANVARDQAMQDAWNRQNDKGAYALGHGEEGTVDANAVSQTGQTAVASATNGSEANAFASSAGGDAKVKKIKNL